MKRSFGWTILFISLILGACGDRPKSDKSFDDIRKLVQGRTDNEVRNLLGEPDSLQPMPLSGERWIWWNYTFLDGKDYPPEERGRVVHLEVIFEREKPMGAGKSVRASNLRAGDALAVSYILPVEESE